MIKALIRAILINGVALFIATQFISGFHLTHGLESLAIVTVVFTIIHLVIKPILKLIFGAINFLTFGLFALALDVAILYALAIFLPQIGFTSWLFPGGEYAGIIIPAYNFNPIGSTIVSAIFINAVRTFLNYLAA
ncbi:phage holin family protein [Candidatus Microgenomates bacterium]|nr:phage holin family protein [Candidatus Microgenomates bacterium]